MVSVVLILLVATTAIASLRAGLQTMGGTEQSARAVTAIREFREYTYDSTIAQLDIMDGDQRSPVLADGSPLPDSDQMTLIISVIPVDDDDPETQVFAGASNTRAVTVAAYSHGRQVLEASWLVAEY